MPTYNFKNNETDEEFQEFFTSFSENFPSDRNIFETLNSFACSKINFLFFLATKDLV